MVVDEETLWHSRAKAHWIKEGDGNTKFFHAVANGRRRVNAISEVVDEGRTLVGEERKREYFFLKFKERLAPGEHPPASVGDWSDLFGAKPIPHPGNLTAPFSLEEIRIATFQLGSDKAPGRDGFNLVFYQKF